MLVHIFVFVFVLKIFHFFIHFVSFLHPSRTLIGLMQALIVTFWKREMIDLVKFCLGNFETKQKFRLDE